jgi:acyl carrier protein phosphodiesterase
MNYLAHALLSLNDPDIQLGNLMGDFVKGNKYDVYPEKVKAGILLHRHIDHYTDTHPSIREAIAFLKPVYRLSGGIFVDILFDHFLANDDRYFNNESLLQFTNQVYENITHNDAHLNERMRNLFFHMSTNNWLYNYRTISGLEQAIQGLCRRHPFLGEPTEALTIIQNEYDELRNLYTGFFPMLHRFVQDVEESTKG